MGDDFGGGYSRDGGTLTVNGGSVCATHDDGTSKSPYGYTDPKNAGGMNVYRVIVDVGSSDSPVTITKLESYGTVGIVPIDGRLYLWLPNGTYSFTANGKSYTATVADGPTTDGAQ